MKTDVIRIGISKGVRIPARILKQCGIGSKAEIESVTTKLFLNQSKLSVKAGTKLFSRCMQLGMMGY